MTILPPREFWTWARQNRWWLGGVGAGAGVVISGWLAILLAVHDHNAALAAIQARQAEQVAALADVRTATAGDLSHYADVQRAWQARTERREDDIVRELSDMNRTLGLIQGRLERSAVLPWWAPRAAAGGADRRGEGMN